MLIVPVILFIFGLKHESCFLKGAFFTLFRLNLWSQFPVIECIGGLRQCENFHNTTAHKLEMNLEKHIEIVIIFCNNDRFSEMIIQRKCGLWKHITSLGPKLGWVCSFRFVPVLKTWQSWACFCESSFGIKVSQDFKTIQIIHAQQSSLSKVVRQIKLTGNR